MGWEYYLVSCTLQTLTWTLCLAIWSEIIRVISQSNECIAQILLNQKYDFGPRLRDTKCNYHCPKREFFSQYKILLIQYWDCLQYVARFSKWPLCLSFSFNLIGYFKRAWKYDWLFCFSVDFFEYHIRAYRALKFFRCTSYGQMPRNFTNHSSLPASMVTNDWWSRASCVMLSIIFE